MTLIDRVSRRLDDEGIRHALIGAAALAARGIARSTFDVDVLATDHRALMAATWEPLVRTGVRADVRRGDADDPLGGVYAGGIQDLWDVRALLALPDADRLIADVDDDLQALPADMRARWADARR